MGRAFHQILKYSIIACLFLAACNKDRVHTGQPSDPGLAPPVTGAGERNVYIACEGNFGGGNATLYMQNLASLTVYENVYLNKNGQALGDVLQSMQRIGDRIFMCVNNSDKVVVIDAASRAFIGKIDIPKPRYILPVNSDKAYVSSEYSNKVYIINPKTLGITGKIEMPAQNPEGMLLLNTRAYICTWDVNCNKVYIVNILTDQVNDSYAIGGYAPQHALSDKDGFVWILSGNVNKGKQSALTKMAPGSADIVASFQFKELQDVIKPTFNNARDMLYFIGVDYQGTTGYNGVYRMNVSDGALPSAAFIPAQKYQYFWGLGVDPVSDDIYVGDPKGFVQKGTVMVYNNKGEQKRVFNVGIGPGYFYFDE